MSSEVTTGKMSQTADWLDWEPPMPPTNLIFDDGERNGRVTATALQ